MSYKRLYFQLKKGIPSTFSSGFLCWAIFSYSRTPGRDHRLQRCRVPCNHFSLGSWSGQHSPPLSGAQQTKAGHRQVQCGKLPLGQPFSKCDSWVKSIRLAREPVRNADPWFHPRPAEAGMLGAGCSRPSRGAQCTCTEALLLVCPPSFPHGESQF